ncbi:MAG: peptidylprolyl isomerase [Alphaproteobacteria bacterium]|nr:peptidylprolyl isomerase [Alphaproteobacteria bacterium]
MTSPAQPVFLRMTIRNLDDDQVFFSNENESMQAVEITPGEGNIFPKVEEVLPTMEIGERKSLTLEKEDAFGDIVKEAVQNVAIENLPEELREVGSNVSAQTQNDQTVHGTVVAIEENAAVIDFNHPLAGKKVEVEFVVVDGSEQ